MTKIRALIMMVVLGLLSACSGGVYRDTATPMQPQANFAPERYLGRWYEIARYPVSFQEGCTATTADYGAIDASTVSVRNTCRQDSPNGPARSIDGDRLDRRSGSIESTVQRRSVHRCRLLGALGRR